MGWGGGGGGKGGGGGEIAINVGREAVGWTIENLIAGVGWKKFYLIR